MQDTPERKLFDIYAESKAYAIESIRLYQHLTEFAQKKDYILSKQYLISSTRIGDFLQQDNIIEAYHAASSAKYWLELLYNGGYIDDDQTNAMLAYCDPLVRILYYRAHPEARKDKEASTSSSAGTEVSSSSAAGKMASTISPTGSSLKGGSL